MPLFPFSPLTHGRLTIDGGLPHPMLLLLTVMAALTVANLHYNVPLLDAIRRDMSVTSTAANLITVLTQTGYAAGLLFIVSLGDLFDARRVIGVNFIVLILALLTVAIAQSIAVLWAASVVIGLSSVAVQMYIPMVSKYSAPSKKARDVGYIIAGVLIGVLWGRVAGGIVGAWLGWRAFFAAAAALMALSGALMVIVMPPLESTFHGTYGALLRSIASLTRRHPEIGVRSLRSALGFASFNALWACMAFHIAAPPFNAGSATVGLLGLYGIATATVSASIGRWLPRYGVRRYNIVGLTVMIASWGILALWGDSYAGLVAGIIGVDVGQQFVGLANQSSALAIDARAVNRINTVYMTIYFIGGAAGTLLSGVGWRLMGWRGVVICGAALLLAAMLSMIKKRQPAQRQY